MIGETEVFGIYLSSELVSSMAALALTVVLHRILVHTGLYRRVWHQALFESALFLIVWGAIVILVPLFH